MNIKFKLTVLNFLEFAVWGAYLISMGGYLAKVGLGANIGLFYSVQGFVSLIIPLLGAISGFFIGGFFANKFSFNNVEMWQAIGVLLGLTITASAIFLLSKTILKFKKTEIVEVL